MYAPIFKCPIHGDIIDVWWEEDFEFSEIYPLCALCHKEVRPVEEDGKQIYRGLTNDEIKQYLGFYDDELL